MKPPDKFREISKESNPSIETPLFFLAEIYKKYLQRAGFVESSINLELNLEKGRPTDDVLINFGRIKGIESEDKISAEEIKERVGKGKGIYGSYGILFEFLKTILSPVIFPGHIAVRTCLKDDRNASIDEFLINIERQEVVLYISDKSYHEGSLSRLKDPIGKQVSFSRHPKIATNKRIDFEKKSVKLEEENFSYILANHEVINKTSEHLSQRLRDSISLRNVILNFLTHIFIENENRKIINYLPNNPGSYLENFFRNYLLST